MGMGRGAGMGQDSGFQPAMPAQQAPEAPPDLELAQLRETIKGLRQQLAAALERIDQLEEKE